VLADTPARVLGLLGLRPRRIVVLKDVPAGNGNWLAEMPGGERIVLRRYHEQATPEELSYEHSVLRFLAAAGWVVSAPVGELVQYAGRWYCPTRYVPGVPAGRHAADVRRRGRDLARLHLVLRGLGERIGQRPGWRAQHLGVTVRTDIDWDACVRGLAEVSRVLGSWACAAAAQAQEALAACGAADLPVTVVHGDFAEWNVHYERVRLAGVIDFGLTHLDSRPYELAMARAHRSPEMMDAYRAELARHGWPLTELEDAAAGAVGRAVRVDLVAWQLDHGRRTANYDLAIIERQLSRTGTAPP
jgi:Ser/Thr protein kinase RdoA (MazF antagonist)